MTLSKADTILLNARRKQSILLDMVVALQATWRMYVVRKKYTGTLHVPNLDFEHGAPRRSARMSHVLVIQRDIRRYLAQRKLRRSICAIVTIQKSVRGHTANRRFAQKKKGILAIQKHVKGRWIRFAYAMLRELVCKVQSRFRGYFVRKTVRIVLEQKMELYRQVMVSLWQSCHVQLSLRTKLWPVFSSNASFARVFVAEREIKRTWELLGISFENIPSNGVADETTKLAESVGIDIGVYVFCRKNGPVLAKKSALESTSPTLKEAYQVEEAERLQIHERLDSKASDNEALYRAFGIPSTEKMKKVAVARAVWSTLSLAESSVSTMLALFPELDGSLNIIFQQRTAKSKRRFPDALKNPPREVLMSKELWDSISLDGLIKKHNQEATHLFVTQVPSLMAKLDGIDRRRSTDWSSMLAVLNATRGPLTPTEKRREMIMSFLNTQAPVKSNEIPFPDIGLGVPSTGFPNIPMGDEEPPSTDFPDIPMENEQEKAEPIPAVDFPLVNGITATPESSSFPDLMEP